MAGMTVGGDEEIDLPGTATGEEVGEDDRLDVAGLQIALYLGEEVALGPYFGLVAKNTCTAGCPMRLPPRLPGYREAGTLRHRAARNLIAVTRLAEGRDIASRSQFPGTRELEISL
jgi:hypothetical protein